MENIGFRLIVTDPVPGTDDLSLSLCREATVSDLTEVMSQCRHSPLEGAVYCLSYLNSSPLASASAAVFTTLAFSITAVFNSAVA